MKNHKIFCKDCVHLEIETKFCKPRKISINPHKGRFCQSFDLLSNKPKEKASDIPPKEIIIPAPIKEAVETVNIPQVAREQKNISPLIKKEKFFTKIKKLFGGKHV